MKNKDNKLTLNSDASLLFVVIKKNITIQFICFMTMACFSLLIGLNDNIKYSFIELYRILNVIICGYTCWLFHSKKPLFFINLFLAITFNPFIKLGFEKDFWQILDFVASGIFLTNIIGFIHYSKKEQL